MGSPERQTITVDDDGGITIPEAFLDYLDLDPPTEVKLVDRGDGSYAVKPVDQSSATSDDEVETETDSDTESYQSDGVGIGELRTREEIVDKNRDRGLRRRDELDVEDSGS